MGVGGGLMEDGAKIWRQVGRRRHRNAVSKCFKCLDELKGSVVAS